MHYSTAFLSGHTEVKLDVLTLLLVTPFGQKEPTASTVMIEDFADDYEEEGDAVKANYPDHPVANYEVVFNTNHVEHDEIVRDEQSDQLTKGV